MEASPEDTQAAQEEDVGQRACWTGPQKAVQAEERFHSGHLYLLSPDQPGFPSPVGRPERALDDQQLGHQATARPRDRFSGRIQTSFSLKAGGPGCM